MSAKWYILTVKSGNEIKVSEKLAEINTEVYCPLTKEIRAWSDRKKKVNVPLFKSYIFVRLKEAERRSVFLIPGVLRYLFWLGKPAVVRDEEMETLRKWLSDENVEELTLSKLVPGESVVIKHGLLKDKNAVVQEVGKKRARLVIQDLGVVINIKLKEIL